MFFFQQNFLYHHNLTSNVISFVFSERLEDLETPSICPEIKPGEDDLPGRWFRLKLYVFLLRAT